MGAWGWPQWVMLIAVLIASISDFRKAVADDKSITVNLTWPATAWVLWMGGFWS